MTERRVVITGLGLHAAHGRDAAAVFDALMAGQSAIAMHTVGEAPHSATIPSAMCGEVDASALLGKGRLAAVDRVSQLGILAAADAWKDAGLDTLPEAERERSAVMMGTCVGGAQSTEKGYRELFVRQRSRLSPLTVVQCMNNAPASHIAQQFDLGGPCHTFSIACASAAAAIAEGARHIRSGESKVVVAGGSEAYLPYGIVKAWQAMHVLAPGADDEAARTCCRPFSADRRGLVLGEGAAVLILEDAEHAKARGARIYAELAGAGSSCDHGHLTAPAAAGQLRALRQALRQAQVATDEVGYVNAHGTATPEGDPVEIAALQEQFGAHAARLMVSATKSMHGHLMGASGAIEALIATLAVHRRQVPPTAFTRDIDPACAGVDHVLEAGRDAASLRVALSNSFAFGGSNVVLALRAV